jgi:NAD(P)-dependent dehydrogenase (short-subunit alcohol dehydrogenase family)
MTETFPGPMAGKTVLVTGSTGGIGRATAAGLATLGARVGITGRDKARAQAAADQIVRETGNPAVDAFAADLSCAVPEPVVMGHARAGEVAAAGAARREAVGSGVSGRGLRAASRGSPRLHAWCHRQAGSRCPRGAW